jgi:Protein of unknown function (DUF4012)
LPTVLTSTEILLTWWTDAATRRVRHHMPNDPIPHPIILVSRDPLVALAIRGTPRGQVHLLQQCPSPAGIRWPDHDDYSVVLDIGPHLRRSAYEAVRRHHAGRLVVILGRDEPDRLPPDPATLTIKRPFRTVDLLKLLATPVPAAPRMLETAAVAGGQTARAPAEARPGTPPPPEPRGRAVSRPAPVAAVRARRNSTGLPSSAKAPARRRPLGRRVLAAVLLPAAVGFLAVVAGFLGGVLEASRDLSASSQAMRAKLTQVDAALADGDVAGAAAAAEGARADLRTALRVTDRRAVRMAARVPVLSASMVDLQHLLNSAAHVIEAADRAVTVYAKFETGRPTVLRDSRVDLSVLAQARTETNALQQHVASARAELLKVSGGPLEPGVDNARAEGLAQLEAVEGRIRPILSFLHIAPSVLGLERDRTYVVVMTNLAQSQPSGGTPEAVARLRVSKGVIAVEGRPTGVVTNLQEARVTWPALPEDPWRPGAAFTEFGDANSSPNFPTSGEELLRAYEAMGGGRADGVVSLDPLALRGLLGVTGGMTVPGYGRLTSDNVATQIMRDAYERWPDQNVRWRHNQALLEAVLRRLFDGQHFVRRAKALGLEASRRHLQIYMRDGQLRQATAAAHLDGALTAAAHDYLAAYTKNEGDNRLDFGQQRRIRQRVELLGDGSAKVTRTMVISYPAAPSAGLGRTPPGGASAASSTAVVAVYLPRTGTGLTVRVNDRPARATRGQEAGRPFARVGTTIRPGASVVVEIGYRLASAAARTAGGLRYEIAIDPQPLASPARLTLEVAFPDGMTVKPGQGWSVLGRTATRTMPFSAPATSRLELDRG